MKITISTNDGGTTVEVSDGSETITITIGASGPQIVRTTAPSAGKVGGK